MAGNPCPRDGSSLVPIPGHPGDLACAGCGGMFLVHPATENSLRLSGFPVQGAGARASAAACPGCGKPMAVRNVSGVEVDLCHGCRAIWLDAGERDRLFNHFPQYLKHRPPAPKPSPGKPGNGTDDWWDGLDLVSELLDLLPGIDL